MNIKGMQNYSRATVGLRQPTSLKDQHFKLVYVYPMLFVGQIDPTIKQTFRKFLSLSFLKEIVVSNSLNVISVASQIDTRSSNVAQLIGQAMLSQSSGQQGVNVTSPTYDPTSKMDYQIKVQEKTALIKRHIQTDTRAKKLEPDVEIITLNNLIDVPVITGTKAWDVSVLQTMFILSLATIHSIPLDKIANVRRIIRILKSTPTEEWGQLLKSLTYNAPNPSWWERRYNIRRALWLPFSFLGNVRTIRSNIQKQKEDARKKADTKHQEQTRSLTTDPQATALKKQADSLFNILNLNKSKLDEIDLNFRMVLDPTLLQSQVGMDISNNTMETTISRVSQNQHNIFNKLHDKFIELMSTHGSIYLMSITNLLYPMYFDINPLDIKDQHFDSKLNTNIQNVIRDSIVKELNNSLGSMSPQQSDVKVKLLKTLCASMDQLDSVLTDQLRSNANRNIDTPNFDTYELNRFIKSFYGMATQFSSMNKRFEGVFGRLVDNGTAILKLVRQHIYSSIEGYMRSFTTRPNYVSALEQNMGYPREKIINTFIPQVQDALFSILYFFFLYRLQVAVCEFIDILDVEVEAAVNDAVDFPNYTLVLPLEVVIGVHTAYISRNYKELIKSADFDDEESVQVQAMQTYKENYTKGMIKFFTKQLRIPSIIVYDEKKQEVYYQFMYMSSSEKIKLTSMISFVRNTH